MEETIAVQKENVVMTQADKDFAEFESMYFDENTSADGKTRWMNEITDEGKKPRRVTVTEKEGYGGRKDYFWAYHLSEVKGEEKIFEYPVDEDNKELAEEYFNSGETLMGNLHTGIKGKYAFLGLQIQSKSGHKVQYNYYDSRKKRFIKGFWFSSGQREVLNRRKMVKRVPMGS